MHVRNPWNFTNKAQKNKQTREQKLTELTKVETGELIKSMGIKKVLDKCQAER